MKDTPIMLILLIGSLEGFWILALSLPVGRILDAGKYRLVLWTGVVFTALGWFTLSFVPIAADKGGVTLALVVLCQGILAGMGMSCFFVSSAQSECPSRL